MVATNKILLLLISVSMGMLISYYLVVPGFLSCSLMRSGSRLYLLSQFLFQCSFKTHCVDTCFSFYIVNKLALDLFGQIFFVYPFMRFILGRLFLAVYFVTFASGFTYLCYGVKSVQFSRGRVMKHPICYRKFLFENYCKNGTQRCLFGSSICGNICRGGTTRVTRYTGPSIIQAWFLHQKISLRGLM